MTLRLSGGRRLQSPPGATARPTAARVRQAVFNLLTADLPGCRWLDLCCGSGVMACEALQRGASEVVAIERDRRVAAVAKANLEAVAAGIGTPPPRLRVIQADARRWLASHAPGAGLEPGNGAVSGPSHDLSPGFCGASRALGDMTGPEGERDADEVGLPGRDGPIPAASDRKTSSPGSRATPAELREQPFDVIYCDPPWPAGLHAPLSEAVARGGWIQPGGTLVWECPSHEVPAPPHGWRIRDQRRYGGSTVVLLEPM